MLQEGTGSGIRKYIILADYRMCYANRPKHKQGLMLELHFSVASNGGLRLPFRGITGYLHGLVSVYERPIIAGGQVWMAYSTSYCHK